LRYEVLCSMVDLDETAGRHGAECVGFERMAMADLVGAAGVIPFRDNAKA